MGEIPSCGTQANARGLAKLAALMANRGTFRNETIMKEETWE